METVQPVNINNKISSQKNTPIIFVFAIDDHRNEATSNPMITKALFLLVWFFSLRTAHSTAAKWEEFLTEIVIFVYINKYYVFKLLIYLYSQSY